jgi:hypothetical protein
MRAMKRLLLAGFALAVLSSAAGVLTPAAEAAFNGETLLMPLPPGFVLGTSGMENGMAIQELVPKGETVDDWTRMVTVQVFHGLAVKDPDSFAEELGQRWGWSCPGGKSTKLQGGTENGYPTALWRFTCVLNPGSGKPETMWVKAIGGQDSFYSVQYAYRQKESDTLAPSALGYLGQVKVCDTRLPSRACPKGS